MKPDWETLCRAPDMRVEETTVIVIFPDERKHRVSVTVQDEEYLLVAVVTRAAAVRDAGEGVALTAWLRNRAVSLAGFRIDEKERLVCEALVPKAGLTAEEFQLHLRMIAIEADRFEYALTGRDAE